MRAPSPEAVGSGFSRRYRLHRLPLVAALAVLAGWAAAAPWWTYPAEPEIEVADVVGDPFAIRVDKAHRLPADFVPEGLVRLPPEAIRTKGEIRVVRALVQPLRQLNNAASRDGVDLSVISGYRSFARQKEVYQFW